MPADQPGNTGGATRARFTWLDTARGLALLAMASYHFMWDLQSFGYAEPDFAVTGLPKIYARAIASTFLFLSGLSLVLSQSPEIKWEKYFPRLAKIIAAAFLVSAGTYLVSPGSFIYFGILHSMAAASILGLAFLRLPAALTFCLAIAAVIAPLYLKSDLFNHAWLWWTGLATDFRRADDFVPVLPWMGPFLFGMALAGPAKRLLAWSSRFHQDKSLPRWHSLMAFFSRHSLAFYLVHQPILIALVYVMSMIAPPPPVDPVANYLRSCMTTCSMNQTADFCTRFCGCTVDRLMEQNLFTMLTTGKLNISEDTRIQRIGAECTDKAL